MEIVIAGKIQQVWNCPKCATEFKVLFLLLDFCGKKAAGQG